MPEAEPIAEEPQDAEPEPEGWVCSPCQRGKHERCSDPECTCCLGNPDE